MLTLYACVKLHVYVVVRVCEAYALIVDYTVVGTVFVMSNVCVVCHSVGSCPPDEVLTSATSSILVPPAGDAMKIGPPADLGRRREEEKERGERRRREKEKEGGEREKEKEGAERRKGKR